MFSVGIRNQKFNCVVVVVKYLTLHEYLTSFEMWKITSLFSIGALSGNILEQKSPDTIFSHGKEKDCSYTFEQSVRSRNIGTPVGADGSLDFL